MHFQVMYLPFWAAAEEAKGSMRWARSAGGGLQCYHEHNKSSAQAWLLSLEAEAQVVLTDAVRIGWASPPRVCWAPHCLLKRIMEEGSYRGNYCE